MDTASSVTMAGSHATIGTEAGHAAMCVKSCRKLSAQVLYGEKRVNLRAGIAQRVGTGLRPGKLRKKGPGKDNKDNGLTRGMHQVGRIRQVSLFK